MPEEAPVNTGAVRWPSPDSADFAVREMQTKLHRWAGDDPSRRFGDLFNLVYDPAFLMHAWERVRATRGHAPPESTGNRPSRGRDRGRGVPGAAAGELKDRSFRPVEAGGDDPEGGDDETSRLGIPTVADRVVQAP